MSDITFYNMKNVFNSNETINSSLVVPKSEPQFNKLNKSQNISYVGEMAVPILYSQTASNGYTSEIQLSQSQYTELSLLNHSVTITENLSSSLYTQLSANYFDLSPIVITENKTYIDDSIMGTIDDPSLVPGVIEFQNSPSINYSLELNFKITSSIVTPSETGTFHFYPYYMDGGGSVVRTYPTSQSLTIYLKNNDSVLITKDAETDFFK